jgi:hypothetical protein
VTETRKRTGVRTPRPPHTRFFRPVFRDYALAARLRYGSDVIWFFERESSLIVCEIRRAADDEEKFEFEIADAEGPTTSRFDSPKELIATYLREQSRLMSQGWRPRNSASIE